MLVKNGLAFVDGAFIRADVRLEGGRIAEVGELEPRDGETIRDAAGLYVCLLYTSPSPRDQVLSRMPSSA